MRSMTKPTCRVVPRYGAKLRKRFTFLHKTPSWHKHGVVGRAVSSDRYLYIESLSLVKSRNYQKSPCQPLNLRS